MVSFLFIAALTSNGHSYNKYKNNLNTYYYHSPKNMQAL